MKTGEAHNGTCKQNKKYYIIIGGPWLKVGGQTISGA